jgi:integral membrane protein (TIGR01906 family)
MAKEQTVSLSAPLRTILVLCTVLLLLLSNLYGVATPAFVRYEYGKPSFPPAELYDGETRFSLAEATLHYMRSSEGEAYLSNLQAQGLYVYNVREVEHLVDAKRVMDGAFWLQGISAFLGIAAAAYAWRHPSRRAAVVRSVAWGCLALFVALVGLGILAYANFDLFFVAFHRIFFKGDSWLFSYADTLIQLFPVQFWIDATWTLALSSLAESVVLGSLAYGWSRRLEPVA